MKTILLSRPARDNDVRFRYSNRAGTSIGGGMRGFVKSAFSCCLFKIEQNFTRFSKTHTADSKRRTRNKIANASVIPTNILRGAYPKLVHCASRIVVILFVGLMQASLGRLPIKKPTQLCCDGFFFFFVNRIGLTYD